MPRRTRPHRILAGPLKGHRIVTSWHDYPAAILGYTERPLIGWFRDHVRPGECWIDVGAHYGYTALALSELVGPAGRVFAFEPVVPTAGCLHATRELNDLRQLHIVPLALSSTARLQLLSAPLLRGMANHVGDGRAEASSEIFAAAFDELWPALAGEARDIDGVKIDVQGMEIEVLHGMRDTLSAWHPLLVVEVHRGVDRSALLQLLFTLGYSLPGEPIGASGSHHDSSYDDDCSYCFFPKPLC